MLPKVPPTAPFPQGSEVDREIFYSIMVVGGRNKPMSWAFRGLMPKFECTLPTNLCFNFNDTVLKLQTQKDCDEEEFHTGSSNEDDATADFCFGSSKPGRRDKNGNPIMTIVDRSGVHEIGISWCCCSEAPDHHMQLMMERLFPATFHNPKTAFTFRVLEDYHLDNLECKTTPSQFFSRLRRLTNDEFPNTVPVGGFGASADGRLTGRLRTGIESY